MSTDTSDRLTPTSYALLGLLAVKPWTTYELTKQMHRSVRWFWPRAERKIYDEPKRLVSLGLATSRSEMTGRRASTVYEISPAGRDALQHWIGESTFEPPAIEMEAMIRLFFAENGTTEQTIRTLGAVRHQADQALVELCDLATEFVEGRDQFPDRRAMNAVTMELHVRINETIRDWAAWAEQEFASWPPVRRRRRSIAAGPVERGTELFADITRRRPPGPVPSTADPTRARSLGRHDDTAV